MSYAWTVVATLVASGLLGLMDESSSGYAAFLLIVAVVTSICLVCLHIGATFL